MARGLIQQFAAVALLVAGLGAGPAAALEFERRQVGGGVRILYLDGSFSSGDDDRFATELSKGPVDEVWFDSGGGSVDAGQGIGRLMRQRGLIGRVPDGAICASACVDAFLGAPVRFVDSPLSVGVHMFSVFRSDKLKKKYEEQVAQGKVTEVIFQMENYAASATARWIDYMMEMGVAPSLISFTVKVPHVCIYWLTAQEMLHYNVVNTGGGPRPGFKPGHGKVEHATEDRACKYAK
ncbi:MULTISPECIES: hypothetical protein [unclassified Meridianimarinicoccus]|uniref:COG3904 family protein n=1 Tax=unclassified Meridianimarinicoccus TaxID=2923344 RepID=UPI0018692313|nr:hypothetical protein [Fluviibacterium sp. MJW13]